MRSWFAALGLITLAVVLPGPWGGGGPALDPPSKPVPGLPGDPVRGAGLFRSLDCNRCHTEPRTGRGANIPASLREAGSRSPAEWTAEYLLDPYPLRYLSEGVRPDLRMPRLVRNKRDAVDLASFLATRRNDALVPAVPGSKMWIRDDAAADEGAQLFEQYQCRGCHELDGSGNLVGPALDDVGRRRRPDYIHALLLNPDALIPGTAMENKDLWEEEARALTAFLMRQRRD